MTKKSLPSLVLASGSPRRRDLLTEHGFNFRVEPSDAEEVTPEHLTVGEIALLNARRKAQAVAERFPDQPVIGVDTLVALEGEPLGKPADLEHARRMLERLNRRSHQVFSGVWICRGSRSTGFVECSTVFFKNFDADQLAAYLRRIKPLDKAGAYAAQDGDPRTIVDRIEGSPTNVIGLPMERLTQVLRELG